MPVAEKIQKDVFLHLGKARQEIKKLIACSPDWTANTILEIEFQNLEEVCDEFIRCHFGIIREKQT